MLYPEVRTLYKYYPPKENRIETILKGNLYFSDPRKFNDPFDSKLKIVENSNPLYYMKIFIEENEIDIGKNTVEDVMKMMSDGKGELKKSILEKYRRTVKFFSKLMDKYGVVSFTTDPANTLMWAHYTVNYTGFCVGYKRDGILSSDAFCFPVAYSRYYPSIQLYDFLQNRNIMNYRFGTKNLEWAYENEWRLVGQRTGIESGYSMEISEIIFGLNTRSEIIERLKKIRNSEMNIIFRKIVQSKSEYKFDLKKVE